MGWEGGKITVGRAEEEAPFLVWQDVFPLAVRYIGVRGTAGYPAQIQMCNVGM